MPPNLVGMGSVVRGSKRGNERMLTPHELPATSQDIDLDRLVWDPDYRDAIKRLLNDQNAVTASRRKRDR